MALTYSSFLFAITLYLHLDNKEDLFSRLTKKAILSSIILLIIIKIQQSLKSNQYIPFLHHSTLYF